MILSQDRGQHPVSRRLNSTFFSSHSAGHPSPLLGRTLSRYVAITTMAEAEFEIDFYGDAGNDQNQHQHQHQQGGHQENEHDYREHDEDYVKGDQGDGHRDRVNETEDTTSHQGSKIPSEEDERPVDPGATAAIMISELSWWTTDDDIRGWLVKAECEAEVKELTFSEHKVNGKSKGCVFANTA